MRSERFRTAGTPALAIRSTAGAIDVSTVDGDETSVELVPLNDAAREAIEEAVVEQRGDEIVVTMPERRRGDARVRIAVECPHGTRLQLRTVSADTQARGAYGDVELNAVSADVRIGAVQGRAGVKTVSGDVRIGAVGSDAYVQTVSGDVSVESVGGSAELRSVSGDVRLDAAGGPVTVQTVSGDQGLRSVARGAVQLKSVSGDVTVGVARGSRVWVDAKSVSGATRSELDLSDAPAGGDDGPLVEIRATALSGDISVTRAP